MQINNQLKQWRETLTVVRLTWGCVGSWVEPGDLRAPPSSQTSWHWHSDSAPDRTTSHRHVTVSHRFRFYLCFMATNFIFCNMSLTKQYHYKATAGKKKTCLVKTLFFGLIWPQVQSFLLYCCCCYKPQPRLLSVSCRSGWLLRSWSCRTFLNRRWMHHCWRRRRSTCCSSRTAAVLASSARKAKREWN